MAVVRETVRLPDLVDAGRPEEVFREVRRTLLGISPDSDFRLLDRIFSDVRRLFAGTYPGYKGCNIRYHDLEHTTDTFLAMARLIRGGREEGCQLGRRMVHLGLVAALMHDTGYIQKDGDRGGTGAKYTANHIRRSIVFAREYLLPRGYSADDFRVCRNALLCTGLDVRIGRIRFRDEEDELIGKMLGTADLIGQMASRRYPEKLPYLYREFREGGVPVPRSEVHFLADTLRFYRSVRCRLADELGGVHRYLRAHFRADRGIDRDLYLESIEENVAWVASALRKKPRGHRAVLKRAASLEAASAPFPFPRTSGRGIKRAENMAL